MSDMSEPERRPRCCPRKVWVIGACLGLFVPAVYVWYFTPPHIIATPVHFSRDVEGNLVADESDETPNGMRLNVHAGELESRNNTSMSSSEMHTNPAFLPERRLAIFNLSDHLLMHRVGKAVLEQLKAESQFEEIDYFPVGHQTETGSLTPDLLLTLDLASLDESGLWGRDLKATVTAHLGTSMATSNYSSHDNQSPPTVNIRADISVDHDSSLTGVESSAAKYTLQGVDIAKQISKHVLDKVKKLREKHSSMPELPAALYPDWVPEPELTFLERLQATRLSGFHGLMLRNDSHWEYSPAGDPIEAVTSIRDELLADGWKESHFNSGRAEFFSLRMERGNATIDVFPDAAHRHLHSHTTITLGGEPEQKAPAPKHFVRYRDRLSREEIRDTIEVLFAAERPDVTLLLAMRSNYQGNQYSRAIALIEKQGVRSADAWLIVAEFYTRKKDVDATRRALACCHFLANTMTDAGDIEQRIRKIAKELKIEVKSLGKPDRELLDTLGFVELNPQTSPAGTVTVRFGESAAFYLLHDDDKVTIYTHTIDRLPTTDRYQIVSLQTNDGSRSWTSGETSSQEFRLHSFQSSQYRIQSQFQLAGPDTLDVAVTMTPLQSKLPEPR